MKKNLKKQDKERCSWARNDLMILYHDHEWGVPTHDDTKLYECLVLESFQSGLSWEIVLNKRENFRKAFFGFDIKKVKKFDSKKVESLLKDAGIIRHRLKIESAINNAKRFSEIQKEFGSFDKYIWGFTNRKIVYMRNGKFQSKNDLSDGISKDLKKRGFKFFGTTTCYAFLQAIGIINEHQSTCFRYKKSTASDTVL